MLKRVTRNMDLRVLAAVVLVAAATFSAATASAVASKRKPKPISAASAFVLPSARHCVSGRKLTVRVRRLRGVTWRSATVKINGKHFRSIKRSQITKPVKLTGLPTGRFVLSITAKARDGRRVTARRRYKTCATTPASPSRRLVVTLAGSGSGTVTGAGIGCPSGCAGSYPAGTTVTLSASPSSSSTFGGWSGGGCTGTGTCAVRMNSDQAVTATFVRTPAPPPPPPPPSAPPLPGSYAGSTSQGFGMRLYVSPDGKKVQDITIGTVPIGCSPSYALYYGKLHVSEIPIRADGSFTATTSEDGVVGGTAARFTYTFSGQFQGTSVAGAFRLDITFDNGVSYTCTSNGRSWSATRETQGNQAPSPPPPGSYAGSTSQGFSIKLYVSPDGKKVQDVTIGTVTVGCAPSYALYYGKLHVSEIPILSDGSFKTTTSEMGVIGSTTAKFTYTFSGHLHGTDQSGVQRVAGAWREDITFDNGVSYTCTSNGESWSATRETQGTQAPSPPPPGSYAGSTSQGFNVKLDVSTDRTHLQNIMIGTVTVGCTPAYALYYGQLHIPDIPIETDGSFSSITSENGTIGGAAAVFTYTFNGHLHGSDQSGLQRLAGTWREDITFNNGTAYTCTSSGQTWSTTGPS